MHLKVKYLIVLNSIAIVYILTLNVYSDMPKIDQTEFEALVNLPWNEKFFDDATTDWQQHWFLDGLEAKIENTSEGMVFTAGAEVGNDAHHAVLWTNKSFEGDLKIEYEFTRLDEQNQGVNILYIQATGTSDKPYERDIAKWANLREVSRMNLYYRHMNALHVSYAAFGSPNSQFDDYIRARRYPSSKDASFRKFAKETKIDQEYLNTGLFKPGVTYQITCIKKSDHLFFVVKGDGREAIYTFDTSAFPEITEGRIGFRQMATRVSRYANIRISQRKGNHEQ